MRKFVGCLALALFAVTAAGCMKTAEQNDVENFVTGYCSILQTVYAQANMEILANVAAEKECKKVFPTIQALKATDNVMKTEILEFAIKESAVEGAAATVTTKERWRYWWEDRKTGSLTRQKSEEAYRLKYHLVKGNGWKVESIENLDDRALNNNSPLKQER